MAEDNSLFCFTIAQPFFILQRVRWFCLVLTMLVAASVRGQEQERKLVDRLLEPNMKLENSAQNKRFTAADGVTAGSFSTHEFYVPERKLAQQFAGTRQVATTSVQSHSFTTTPAHLPQPLKTQGYVTKQAGAPPRIESATYPTREFAGNRPWAHLDIAGPARADKEEHEVPKGATGYGARLLLRWLESL